VTPSPFLGIGAIGAFTTFSTLAVETVLLVRAHHEGIGFLYASGSIILGIAATLLGLFVAGWRPTELPPPEGES
jgi:fluoride exporter